MLEFAHTLIPKHNIAIITQNRCKPFNNPALAHYDPNHIRYEIGIYLMKAYGGVTKVIKTYKTEKEMLEEYARIKSEL